MIGGAFTRNWFDPDVLALWDERATVGSWFEVEVALAAAQAELGMIPADAAAQIAARADAGEVDLHRISDEIARTSHPFVPALHQLEELCGEEAAAWLHWGATTQNIFDTATALRLKRSHALLLARLRAALARLAEVAAAHRLTPQAGRTHGQHALPISFGLKVAAWMAELGRHVERLTALEHRVFVARMGGAVGAFAAMDGHGRAVQRRVGELLGLADGGIPMRSSVDHFAEYVCVVAQFAATVEKIGTNLIFLQRTELAEAGEGFHAGKVGSSTMAQKRNPARLMTMVGLARLLRLRTPGALDSMVQTDEADGAASQVCDAVVPESAILAVSLAMHLESIVATLDVDPAAMAANLDRSRGLIMTEAVMMRLAPVIGRHRAHQVLYDVAMAAFEQGEPLADALARQPEIRDAIDIGSALAPRNYLGESASCVDEQVARWRRVAHNTEAGRTP